MKKFGCVVLSLLIGTAACSAMAGCGKSYDGEVNVYNWGEYIANGEDGTLDVIDEFEKEYNIKVNYTTYETNEELYNMLKNSNVSYDVIIPSDYMISKLISENMRRNLITATFLTKITLWNALKIFPATLMVSTLYVTAGALHQWFMIKQRLPKSQPLGRLFGINR